MTTNYQEKLDYIEKLIIIATRHEVDCIEVDGIKVTKSIHRVKEVEQSPADETPQPEAQGDFTDDELFHSSEM